jgi:hypothetical protein
MTQVWTVGAGQRFSEVSRPLISFPLFPHTPPFLQGFANPEFSVQCLKNVKNEKREYEQEDNLLSPVVQ